MANSSATLYCLIQHHQSSNSDSWQDAKVTQYYVALEFMLRNSGTKLPAQCMLGRRGEFEGLADWLPMLPLWLYLFLCVQHEQWPQILVISLSQHNNTDDVTVHTFQCRRPANVRLTRDGMKGEQHGMTCLLQPHASIR